MAIRTIDDLTDRLDDAMAWRRIELQALKSAILSAESRSPGSPLSRALARSGIALLYAHWEGYVKESCTAYAEYIARRKLRYDELNDGLLKTVLESLGKRASSGDDEAREALFEAIRRPSFARARVPKTSMADTKSNLRYHVLSDLLGNIGLSADDFMTKDKLINVALCDSRNSIAHGRDFFPSPIDFPDLMDEVLSMIEQVRDLIISAARLASYRRTAQST